jgi:hypothetical protein
MKSPASNLGLGSEFDHFLFAPIAEDRNGLTVSVVSMLGRLNLDPWQAAASLAGLPVELATQKLTALLDRLPGPPLQEPDSRTLAIRLVALLPHRPENAASPLQTSAATDGSAHARRITNGAFIAIYLGVMLATQLVMAYLGPTRDTAAHPSPSIAAPSQTPPSASVK